MLVTHISVAGITAESPISLTPVNAAGEREPATVVAQEAQLVTDESAEKTVKEVVRAYFADAPEMYSVAWCESRVRHFKEDGTLLRGYVDHNDVGVMQINERYHLKRSKELGYNIYSLEGNLAYARVLYEDQGLQPWSASKPCWSQRNHLAQR
ncbi:MAG: hypothetical protein WDZ79_02180 [Candidatus Paceibacterota bacterium]